MRLIHAQSQHARLLAEIQQVLDELPSSPEPTSFLVVWDNDQDCGALPGRWPTEAEALAAGEAWWAEMVLTDPDPAEAAMVYSYEVVGELANAPS